MHDKQVRRRRAVLGVLVGVSLILLTAYFGESPTSPLHTLQRGIVEVLSPIQEGASKVLSPVRNVAGWFSDTLRAKSEVDRDRRLIQRLQAEVAQYRTAAILNRQLSKAVGLDTSLSAYRPLTASVIERDPIVWYQTIEIDKGADDGVKKGDPVLDYGALVGVVTTVDPTVSWVSLITDHTVSVTAEVLDQNGDTGELVPAVGNPSQLVLQYLNNETNQNQLATGPQAGQQVVTSGFRSGPDESLYPSGIPIGTVSGPVNTDQLLNQGVLNVTPTADLSHLNVVQVLTAPQAGTERAQIP